ncbi:MAG: hypothetical protein OQK76_05315 [Gammaproteobacteria bacterium]|nr:hypothetical protein [Gammaproteobacteria bacterium]MCW9056824.1 hypothetical protein [Gammaproteobacteria bacterium]
MNEPHDNDPATELAIINKKRAALQKLVKLTSMLSRLHQGLQSVLLMGNPTSYIPEKVISNFKNMTDKLASQSTEKLQITLSNTDIKINRDIKRVLEISQQNETELTTQIGQATNTSSELNFEEYVAAFKKNAQTSIALRIALKARNTPIKPFSLSIPEKFINHQILELDEKETACKSKIQSSMETINHDIGTLIKRADFPDDMKKKLDETRAHLRSNIDYFSSGGPIENMPILSEQFEEPQNNAETTNEGLHVDTTTEESEAEVITPIITEKEKALLKRSLITRTKEWLFTPWNTKWKDIDKYK